LELMKKRGAAIACCPLSNFFFADGSLKCRRLMATNVKVGLGTDISGGYSPSMLQSTRDAVIASHSIEHCDSSGDHAIDYRHAFYLATLGGAIALGLSHRIGTLAVGMEFDAFIFASDTNTIIFEDTDSLADVFQKLCVLGDDRNVDRVFVQGNQVHVRNATIGE